MSENKIPLPKKDDGSNMESVHLNFNSLTLEKKYSLNNSNYKNAKSPKLNLMITPSVDFNHLEPLPRHQVNIGDFVSNEKCKYNNREGLTLRNVPRSGAQPLNEISLSSKDNCNLRCEEITLRNKQINQNSKLNINGRSGSYRNTNILNQLDSRDDPRTPNARDYKSKSSAQKLQLSQSKFNLDSVNLEYQKNENKAITNLKDELVALKKQLKIKDADYSKDKAVWTQKSQLADKEIFEMRQQMENQKQKYMKMIKLTDSPIKYNGVIDLKITQQNGNEKAFDSMTQEEIKKEAELLAQILIQGMQNKELEVYKKFQEDSERRLKDQYIELLTKKQGEIKDVTLQLEQMNYSFQKLELEIKQKENDRKDTQNLLQKQQDLMKENTDSQKTYIIKLKSKQETIEQMISEIKQKKELIQQKDKQNQFLQTNLNQLNKKFGQSQKEFDDLTQSLKHQNSQLSVSLKVIQQDSYSPKPMNRNIQKFEIASQTQELVKEDNSEMQEQMETFQYQLKECLLKIENLTASHAVEKAVIQQDGMVKDEIIQNLRLELQVYQEQQIMVQGLKQDKEMPISIHSDSDNVHTELSTNSMAGSNIIYEQNNQRQERETRSRSGYWMKTIQPYDTKEESNDHQDELIDQIYLSNKQNDNDREQEVLVENVDSKKDSVISFQASGVSNGFLNFSKKSNVVDPPSFSEEIIGQQVTALQAKQSFGKIPGDMKKFIAPESAGLPVIRKLGSKNQPKLDSQVNEENHLKIQYNNENLFQDLKNAKDTIASGSEASARFQTQNFSQNEIKCQDVHTESMDMEMECNTENSQDLNVAIINNSENGEFLGLKQTLQTQQTQSRHNIRYDNTSYDNNSFNQDQFDLTTSQLQIQLQPDLPLNDSRIDTEMEVPICIKSQPKSLDSSLYPLTSHKISKQDGKSPCETPLPQSTMKKKYLTKDIQQLQNKVNIKQNDFNTKSHDLNLIYQGSQMSNGTTHLEMQNGLKVVTVDTMTQNRDCLQYSATEEEDHSPADVLEKYHLDITKQQQQIQEQIDGQSRNHVKSSILLSDGFGSSNCRDNSQLLHTGQSQHSNLIPSELTKYTISQGELDKSSIETPNDHLMGSSVYESQIHQNFESNQYLKLQECGVSEVQLSQSFHRKQPSRVRDYAQQLEQDQSLLMLIKDMNFDDINMSLSNFQQQSELLERCLKIQSRDNSKKDFKAGSFVTSEIGIQQNIIQQIKPKLKQIIVDQGNVSDSQDSLLAQFRQQPIEGTEERKNSFFYNQIGSPENDIIVESEASIINELKDSQIIHDHSRQFTFKQQKSGQQMESLSSSQYKLFKQTDSSDGPTPFNAENIQTGESVEDDRPCIFSNENIQDNYFNTVSYKTIPQTSKVLNNPSKFKFRDVSPAENNIKPNSFSKNSLLKPIKKGSEGQANHPRKSPNKQIIPSSRGNLAPIHYPSGMSNSRSYHSTKSSIIPEINKSSRNMDQTLTTSMTNSQIQRQHLFQAKQKSHFSREKKKSIGGQSKVAAAKALYSLNPTEENQKRLFKNRNLKKSIDKSIERRGSHCHRSQKSDSALIPTGKKVKKLQRNLSSGNISDFQFQLQQYQKMESRNMGLGSAKSQKNLKSDIIKKPIESIKECLKQTKQDSRIESEYKSQFSQTQTEKHLADLKNSVNLIQNFTRIQNLQNMKSVMSTKSNNGAPTNRKLWTTNGKENPAQINVQKINKTKSAAPSNLASRGKKEFQELQNTSFRKFDLDNLSKVLQKHE